MRHVRLHPSSQVDGFTYLGLMFLLAMLAVAATAATEVYRISVRRDQEADLFFVGHAYKAALESYARKSGSTAQPYPQKLEALIRDDRNFTLVRHLRQLYTDPLNPGKPLVLIRNSGGGIVGVYSSSEKVPIRLFGLPEGLAPNAKNYQAWHFVADGAQAAPVTQANASPLASSNQDASPTANASPGDDFSGAGAAPPIAPYAARNLNPDRRTPEVCLQLAQLDQLVCTNFENQGKSTLASECLASAAVRSGQCTAGQALSPLVIR